MKYINIMLSLLLLFFTTGCWSSVELQNQSFITAVGIDYKDGQYYIYTQVPFFNNLARQENSTSQKPLTYVSQAKDRTIDLAIDKVYDASQQRVRWGQIKALVIGEGALKRPLMEYMDLLTRYREFRYSIWIYGTKSPIEKIFSTLPFFNATPVHSILAVPVGTYEQLSLLPPIELYRFISEYQDKGTTAYLPRLSINDTTWKENKKKHPLLDIDGAYFFNDGSYRGFMSRKQLNGYEWLHKQTTRSPLYVFSKDHETASIHIERPNHSITTEVIRDKVYYTINIIAKSTIKNLTVDIPFQKLTTLAENKLKKEVLDVYKKGLEKNIDVYQLEAHFYRRHPQEWKRLSERDHAFLHEDAIKKVDVSIDIRYTGKYKYPTQITEDGE